MKEEKGLPKASCQLREEQLEQVGGGINPATLCYGYCNECGWKSAIDMAKRVKDLIYEHKNQTGHSDITRRFA